MLHLTVFSWGGSSLLSFCNDFCVYEPLKEILTRVFPAPRNQRMADGLVVVVRR